MSVPGNTWSTYGVGYPYSIGALANQGFTGAQGAGNRENLMDPIVILDPTDTPTLNLLPKEELTAPYVEWLFDTLAATSTTPTSEGADFSESSLSPRQRFANVTQIQRIDFKITRTQVQTSQRGLTAGVRNEYQYQLFKALKALLRNVNARVVANGSATVGSASGTTSTDRRTAVLRAFMTGNAPCITTSVGGAFGTGSFSKLHQTMDAAGADPDTLLVSSGVKADISNTILNLGTAFPSGVLRRFNQDAFEKEMSSVIDVLEDDFGRVMIIRDRWIPQQSTTAAAGSAGDGGAYFLVDRAKIKIAFFQRPDHFPLPPNGDAQRGFVLTEFLVKVLHPSALGIGYNVTTS